VLPLVFLADPSLQTITYDSTGRESGLLQPVTLHGRSFLLEASFLYGPRLLDPRPCRAVYRNIPVDGRCGVVHMYFHENGSQLSHLDWHDSDGQRSRTFVSHPNPAQCRYRTVELGRDGTTHLQMKDPTRLLDLFQQLGTP
jgi:hypothetical protein